MLRYLNKLKKISKPISATAKFDGEFQFVKAEGQSLKDFTGLYVYVLQDVQSSGFWISIGRSLARRELCPVFVCYSDEDFAYYRKAINFGPSLVARAFDHYGHVVAGGDMQFSDENLYQEITKREQRHDILINRAMIQSDRHLGRGLTTGARGFPRSKISARSNVRSNMEAALVSFRFWEELWSRFPPALVLSFSGGGGIAGRPAVLMCRETKTPFRNLMFSRFGRRFFWGDNEFGSSLRFNKHLANLLERGQVTRSYLNKETQLFLSPDAVAQRKSGERLLSILASIPEVIARHVYGHYRGYAKSKRGYYLHEAIFGRLRVWYHRKWLDRYATLALSNDKFVYFPLSVEPEITTTLFCEYASDQLANVKRIADALPVGFLLMVKEHPWAVGHRDLAFYKEIKSHPRIVLIHPDHDSNALLAASKGVAAGASSVVYEAAVLGKPTLHAMVETPVDLLSHVFRIADLQAGQFVKAVKSGKISPRAKADGMIYLVAAESFGFEIYWKGLNDRTIATEDQLAPILSDLADSIETVSNVSDFQGGEKLSDKKYATLKAALQ